MPSSPTERDQRYRLVYRDGSYRNKRLLNFISEERRGPE